MLLTKELVYLNNEKLGYRFLNINASDAAG